MLYILLDAVALKQTLNDIHRQNNSSDIDARPLTAKIINELYVQINSGSYLSGRQKMFISRKVFKISM